MINLNQNSDFSTIPILRLGFRVFFLVAGIVAVSSMFLWLLFYQFILIPVDINPINWHAHEMIFAYGVAVVVGFLLTASKNWTGVQTLYDKPLLALLMLWIMGRFAFIISPEYLIYQAIIDSGFLIFAVIAISCPIIKAKNWNNIGIVAKILLLAVAHILYYLGLLGYLDNGTNIGLYSGFYLIISLLLMMTRRLLPFFIERGIGLSQELPNSKFLDISSLVIFFIFMVVEVFWTTSIGAIFASILFVIHLIRMINWYHLGIWQRPLLWSMYLAYGFLTFGFLLYVLKYFVVLTPNLDTHSFAFGVGLMSVSMMARVSLGHTGRNVFKPPKMVNMIFITLSLAFIFRIILPIIDIEYYTLWILISQILWIVSFMIFLIIYAPMFFKTRADGQFG